MWFKKKKVIAVHDGRFHADDVFACATLSLVLDRNVQIIRTRKQEELDSADYVVDVGGVYDSETNRFDHHQPEGAGVRENGIPYASFGLVWKTYGDVLTGDPRATKRIDENLVSAIDAGDNGVSTFTKEEDMPFPYIIQRLFGSFMPTWKESFSPDLGFFKALTVARDILKREIAHSRAHVEATEKVEEVYNSTSDKRVIVLPESYPWGEVLTQKEEPLFVISSKEEGRWKIEAVTVEPHSFVNRKSFPEAWAGLRDSELEAVTGVEGSVFCHKARFLCVATTKEAALQLAEIALKV